MGASSRRSNRSARKSSEHKQPPVAAAIPGANSSYLSQKRTSCLVTILAVLQRNFNHSTTPSGSAAVAVLPLVKRQSGGMEASPRQRLARLPVGAAVSGLYLRWDGGSAQLSGGLAGPVLDGAAADLGGSRRPGAASLDTGRILRTVVVRRGVRGIRSGHLAGSGGYPSCWVGAGHPASTAGSVM